MIYTTMGHSLIVVILMLNALYNQIHCSVIVEISLESFSCERNIVGHMECDSYFLVCMSTRNQTCKSNQVRTSTVKNKGSLTDLLHNKHISPNPILFKIHSFKEIPFVVHIEVHNHSPKRDRFIVATTWVYNHSTVYNQSSIRLQGLTISLHIKCDQNFYGPSCDRYCVVDKGSFCNKDGMKQCLSGFVGDKCNKVTLQPRTPNSPLENTTDVDTTAINTKTQTDMRSYLPKSHSSMPIHMEIQENVTTLKSSTVQSHTESSNHSNTPRRVKQAKSSPTHHVETTEHPRHSTISETAQKHSTSLLSTSQPRSANTSFSRVFDILGTSTKSTLSSHTDKHPKVSVSGNLAESSSELPREYSSTQSSNTTEISVTTTRDELSTIDQRITTKENTAYPQTMPTTVTTGYIVSNSTKPPDISGGSTPSFSIKSTKQSTQSPGASTITGDDITSVPSSPDKQTTTHTQATDNPKNIQQKISKQTNVPVKSQPWIMPLAISLVVVAVVMAVVAAIIFNYFKKKQRLVPYIEMLDNDAEVELFRGGSLQLQLEPQTCDGGLGTDNKSNGTPNKDS